MLHSSTKSLNDSRGAVWRRWEPHIHTPGTLLNDQYGQSTMDEFLTTIEAARPKIQALGITDYYLLRRYEQVVAARSSGRLGGVGLLFCNVEMRLSIETRRSKGINLHLLVSPDDPDHVEKTKHFLSRLTFPYAGETYQCSESDLRRLGRAHKPGVVDDEQALKEGGNQFKVDFRQFRSAYEDSSWMQSNTLVAIAGSSNDGTAGLQDEAQSFAAVRKEIETFADIIFTATPSSISFWRGDGSLSDAQLASEYRGLKPCLHGSDAHELAKVATPDHDRYCWIKGDPAFESLRQACLEPRLRTHIGAELPETAPQFGIDAVETPGTSWLLPYPLPLNSGLVAIIGSRGSGKTALADLIAHAASSSQPLYGQQSFLNRAAEFTAGASVEITLSDGRKVSRRLKEWPTDLPDVNYLTQQFVDQLCSAESESDELLDEIKRVVFLAHDPAARMGAVDFDSLVDARSSQTQLAAGALAQRLDRLSQDVLTMRSLRQSLPDLEKNLDKSRSDLQRIEAAQREIVRPGGKDRADYYARLNAAVTEREQQVQSLQRSSKAYKNLMSEVARYNTDTFPLLLADLQRIHGSASLTDAEWLAFLPRFSGSPATILEDRITAKDREITAVVSPTQAEPGASLTAEELQACALQALKDARDEVGKEISVDEKNSQRLTQLNKRQATLVAAIRRLEGEVERAKAATERLRALFEEREKCYEEFSQLTIAQCDVLSELYEPLKQQLGTASSAAHKLSLSVIRDVGVDAWASRGEELLDLRKTGDLKGRGALAAIARESLLPAWRSGTAAEVRTAMEEFRKAYNEALLKQSKVEVGSEEYQQWTVELGRWLYSTDHISVQYCIEYDGVAITQLSPGTRGIVLLLLYLALDLEDSRPLIIDQPEENLDPKSVYSELVGLFREARSRRQVIIVTHNANLVVNTDADQVIVASCVRGGSGGPPQFEYRSGGLENPVIRADVCEILEGGEAAFRERARRLRVNM